jgi:predicted DCC family thiol-disulfide oxidoreductase YuxK
MSTPERKLTVYYDGACPRCVDDRARYEALAGAQADTVCWVDITGRDEELRACGIDPQLALRELHVADSEGRVRRELDAYILLMSRVPRLRALAWLIGLPGVRPLVSALYRASVLRRLRASGRMPTDGDAGMPPQRQGPPGDSSTPPDR